MIIKTVKDLDKSFARRSQGKVEALIKKRLTVGIHQKDNRTYENGATTAEVGVWQEFGTAKLPPRIWLRFITMENKERQASTDVFRQAFNDTDDVDRIVNRLGSYMKDRIKDRILRNGVIPHSNNKSGITLVDTGQLVESIDYEVQ